MNKITLTHIPFLIVLISIFFPVFGGLLGINVVHAPTIVLVASIILLIYKQKKIVFYNNFESYLCFFIIIVLVMHLILGMGAAILSMGGYVVIYAFTFYLLLRNLKSITPYHFLSQVSIIFKIIIMSMFLEIVLILLGYQYNLELLITGYKDYNGAEILRYFGFWSFYGGLNSMLIGSQIAGMISLFSTIWFINARFCHKEKYSNKTNLLWIILSLLLLIITINVTNSILLLSAIFIFIFSQLRKYRITLSFILISSATYFLYLSVKNGYLFHRVFNNRQVNLWQSADFYNYYGILHEVIHLTTIEYYVYVFTAPLRVLLSENLFNQLFGVGNFYANTQVFIGGDFAYGSAILFSGIIFVSLFTIYILLLLFKNINIKKYNSLEQRAWVFIGFSSALISFLFLLSTIHYGQAFTNSGVTVIFSFLIAIANYSRYRFNSLLISENEY